MDDDREFTFTHIPPCGLYIDLNKTYEVRQDGCTGHLLRLSESERTCKDSKEHYFIKGIDLLQQIQFMIHDTKDKYILDREVQNGKTVYRGLITKNAMERFMQTPTPQCFNKHANITRLKPYGLYIDLNAAYVVFIDPYMQHMIGYIDFKNDLEIKGESVVTGFELLLILTPEFHDSSRYVQKLSEDS